MSTSPDDLGDSLAGRPVGRKAFFGLVAGGVSSLWWAAGASSFLSPVTSGFSQALGNALPVGGWRIYTVSGTMPVFDPETWRLQIGGLIRKPISLDYRQLLNLPRSEQVSTFHCVTGWTIKNVRWGGVRLADLFSLAHPMPNAHAVRFVSMENPYQDSLTLDQARLADVMLAYEMDGKPLSRPHGAPVRLVIPDMYGYKSVKWVTQIVLDPAPTPGFWEQLGYDRDAWIGRSNGYSS
jgi:DMSO/TMAO reductase YedYZ molybdopterin-dependent catalytic subunit